ncbi:hypothetical protein C8J57DRAFT_698093 [Mycena rebaudengoi]|nr:hypothetical protein C8J57DRAFT_698093 [Mycena rebaudengoi]
MRPNYDRDLNYAVDALHARKSTKRVLVVEGRLPPRKYEQWLHFAQDRLYLIDEYDKIHRDFKPFCPFAKENPSSFKTGSTHVGLAMTWQFIRKEFGTTLIQIRDGITFLPATFNQLCQLHFARITEYNVTGRRSPLEESTRVCLTTCSGRFWGPMLGPF